MISVSSKIQHLVDLITFYDNEYWNNDNTVISNDEYDQLKQQLRNLDPTNELLKKVYIPIHNQDKRKKVYYSSPMLSLKKVYNIGELQKWCESVIRTTEESFIIEPKFDGIASYYQNKTLSTSGTGDYGFDITDKFENKNMTYKQYLERVKIYQELEYKMRDELNYTIKKI